MIVIASVMNIETPPKNTIAIDFPSSESASHSRTRHRSHKNSAKSTTKTTAAGAAPAAAQRRLSFAGLSAAARAGPMATTAGGSGADALNSHDDHAELLGVTLTLPALLLPLPAAVVGAPDVGASYTACAHNTSARRHHVA